MIDKNLNKINKKLHKYSSINCLELYKNNFFFTSITSNNTYIRENFLNKNFPLILEKQNTLLNKNSSNNNKIKNYFQNKLNCSNKKDLSKKNQRHNNLYNPSFLEECQVEEEVEKENRFDNNPNRETLVQVRKSQSLPCEIFEKRTTKSRDYIEHMKVKLEKKRSKTHNKGDLDSDSTILFFNPPDWRWQRNKTNELGLPFERILWMKKAPWTLFTVDTPPKKVEHVSGDGNCLFRSFSFWVTGNEESHLSIRELLIKEFLSNPETYLALTNHSSVENYLRETRMHQEGIWGTEVEIFIAATLLNTPVAVFAAFGDKALWQLFKPLKKQTPATAAEFSKKYKANKTRRQQADSSSTLSTSSSPSMEPSVMMYLHNSRNHFEPVLDIQN